MLTILPRFQSKGFAKELLIQVPLILSENAPAKILRDAKACVIQGQLFWCAGYVKLICISWVCQKWEKWLDCRPCGSFWAVLKSLEGHRKLKVPWDFSDLQPRLESLPCSPEEKVCRAAPASPSCQAGSHHPKKKHKKELACWRIDLVSIELVELI